MTELILPEKNQALQAFSAINQFQEIVRSQMREGHDFGVIPGTSKPTLLKPGAEKIAKLLGLADQYEIMDRQEDWNRPFFRYLIKCSLVSVASGIVISEGLGECNSMEAKYRWREAKKKCPNCGSEVIIKGKVEYGGGWICFQKKGGCGAKWPDGATVIEEQKTGKVENDDIYSQVNTILKMSKKRALVDAALSAGRLSELFTQDIEDMVIEGSFEEVPTSAPDGDIQGTKTTGSTSPPKTAQKGQKQGGEKTYDDVWALAKTKGVTTPSSLNHTLGIKSLKEMTPEACIGILSGLPDALQPGMEELDNVLNELERGK